MFDGIDPEVRPFFVSAETWPAFSTRVRPHLEKMAEGSGGRFAASDVGQFIVTGRMQMWLALDGAEIACAMVTEIVQYPRLRAMRCVGVVGSRPRRWLHLLSSVEQAARDHFGCQKMEALHQFGHERLLRTGGWQPFHILSEKTL
jgi:hypothetical protein